MRIIAYVAALACLTGASASQAASYILTFVGQTGSFQPYNTNPTVEAALPPGTFVSGQIEFETAIYDNVVVPASGSAMIGNNAYTVLDTETYGGGGSPSGQDYAVYDFTLSGPTVPAYDADHQAGRFLFNIGIAEPDPLMASPAGYPYPSIEVSFAGADGYGGNSFYDPIIFSRVSISAAPASSVPEPASWAMMMTGFGITGVAMRRRRSAASRSVMGQGRSVSP